MAPSIGTPALWIGFHVFVFIALFIDLFVLHKDAEKVSKREAALWSVIWISCALFFGAGLWWAFGNEIGMQFFAGYLIEESLSVDNLFVFMLIFAFFKVPEAYQHRVLFWGIFGAIVLRGVMISMGVALLARFEILILILAAVLIYSSLKLLISGDEDEEDLSNNAHRPFHYLHLKHLRHLGFESALLFIGRGVGRLAFFTALPRFGAGLCRREDGACLLWHSYRDTHRFGGCLRSARLRRAFECSV